MIIMEREIPQEIRMVISWNRRILAGRITTAMETTIKIIPDLIIREVPEITIQTIMEITEITLVPKISNTGTGDQGDNGGNTGSGDQGNNGGSQAVELPEIPIN